MKKTTYTIEAARQDMAGGSFYCRVYARRQNFPVHASSGKTPEEAEENAIAWVQGQREMAKAAQEPTPLG